MNNDNDNKDYDRGFTAGFFVGLFIGSVSVWLIWSYIADFTNNQLH